MLIKYLSIIFLSKLRLKILNKNILYTLNIYSCLNLKKIQKFNMILLDKLDLIFSKKYRKIVMRI